MCPFLCFSYTSMSVACVSTSVSVCVVSESGSVWVCLCVTGEDIFCAFPPPSASVSVSELTNVNSPSPGPHSQFHTASPTHEAYISAEGPQIWRGQITIAYRERELHAAVERLQELVRCARLTSKIHDSVLRLVEKSVLK
jgi:hypothetical protein